MISTTSFEQILNEYRKKSFAAESAAKERKAFIESSVPEIKTIENEIASISVAQAKARIRGDAGDPDYLRKIDYLKSEKERLLKENGYSAEDLEPRYDCPDCRDTGYIDDQMCSCLKRRITKALYEQMNLQDILKEENFEHFLLDYYSNDIPKGETESPLSLAVKARKEAMDFVTGFDRTADNLLITGSTGVGKTFLVNCIVKELLERNYFVIYLTSGRFFKTLSDAIFKRQDAANPESEYIAANIYSCDLLVIDDLGTELVNSFVINTLFDLINERLARKKHTIISTNLSLNQIRDIYTERIVSRLMASYKFLKLTGDDIRIRKLNR